MKNLFIIIFLLSIYATCSSQTKAEKYKNLNEKIDIYKHNDSEKNYNYLLHEAVNKEKKVIKFIQFCTAYKLCSTAYYLNVNEYTGITVKEKDESKYIQIFFPLNSIETQQINIKTEEHFNGETTSSITIFLEKNTPLSEVNNIIKGVVDLLKSYGIEKKDALD